MMSIMINLMNCFLVVTVSVDRKERRLKRSAALRGLTATIDKPLFEAIYLFYSNHNELE